MEGGQNILPSKVNLQKKGMSLDISCPLYQTNSKSIEYLLLHCHFTKQVWVSSPLGCHIPPSVDVHGWIEFCLQATNMFGVQLSCYTIWKIWESRNKLIFKQSFSSPSHIVFEALESLLDFNLVSPSPKAKIQNLNLHYNLSNQRDHVVINVDVGCYDDDDVFSLGVFLGTRTTR